MNYAIHVPEDTETESRFRGIISNKINSYYIINEIASKPYMKILTGVKLNPNKEERKNEAFEKTPYNLAYFSKKYIKETIFDTQNRTDKEKENVKYKQEKNDFCNLIIDYIIRLANKPDMPKFPDKMVGVSKKLYQGFTFVKKAKFDGLFLEDEFYEELFNKS